MLKLLENLELAGITFIRDYIQFLFDGPVLNTYTLPQIKIDNDIISKFQSGYYDMLCSLIGKRIIYANEDKKENKIVIRFEENISLTVSLRLDDRQCAEAVMLQMEQGMEWNIW